MIVVSRSTEETEALGEKLGSLLDAGDFVGLRGDLGAGKTAFVRGVARGAGVPREAQVSSPTFAIVNTYAGGRLPLLHADLYRVKDADELYAAGFYDLFEGEAALLVEWIDRVPEVVPQDWLEFSFEHVAEGRRIVVTAHGERAREIAAKL